MSLEDKCPICGEDLWWTDLGVEYCRSEIGCLWSRDSGQSLQEAMQIYRNDWGNKG